MKKILLFVLLSISLIPESFANPGDTTWVTIYNDRKITQYGNYDTSAVLPTGKTFRKINIVVLGITQLKYMQSQQMRIQLKLHELLRLMPQIG